MPKGISKNPQETSRKLRLARTRRKDKLGYINSPESRAKISKAKKGKIPKSFSLIQGWNKGKKHTEETKRKMSQNHGRWNKGMKFPYKSRPSMKGRKIWNKGLKGFMGGNKHYNWKGGVAPINQIIRGSLEYKLWEDSVKNRDNNCCQKCEESRVNKLVGHHILNFSSHIELRFAIDNGITFCRECHKKFHKKYGYKNNTREQVEDYLKSYQ